MNAQHRQAARQRYQEALWVIDHDPEYRRESGAVLAVVWGVLAILIAVFWFAAWWVAAWVVESVWRLWMSGGHIG